MHPAQNDPRGIDELFAAALTDLEDVFAWDAIAALHYRATREVLDRAIALGQSPCPHERQVGAHVMAQLGVLDRVYPDECVAVLFDMLSREQEPAVLCAILSALGHQHDARRVVPAVPLRAHPDPNVRHSVVFALTGSLDPVAIASLIELSRDEDSDVRDWATFALGTQIDLDTPILRDALTARLDDSDDDTRSEALFGLARRRDPRVFEPLYKELQSPEVLYQAIDAARELADPLLHPLLAALRPTRPGGDMSLEDAIAACSAKTSD